MLQVIKIFKVVITSILIFALFFISYFIIRIILKSRNVYFTTLRMLGATTKMLKDIRYRTIYKLKFCIFNLYSIHIT